MFNAAAAKLDPFAPPCPKCKAPLDGIEVGEGEGVCGACASPLDYVTFPAMRRPKPVARAVRSVDGDATCFFHAQNQAAAVCDDCGRYLCVVCEVPSEDARRLCPPCVSGQRKKTPQKADGITTYDSIAMTLALLPILIWPFTLVTAPAAVTVAIIGLRKPRSLVRRGTARLVFAMILGVLQIGGWMALGVSMWLA
jgi:hypothetical protein